MYPSVFPGSRPGARGSCAQAASGSKCVPRAVVVERIRIRKRATRVIRVLISSSRSRVHENLTAQRGGGRGDVDGRRGGEGCAREKRKNNRNDWHNNTAEGYDSATIGHCHLGGC